MARVSQGAAAAPRLRASHAWVWTTAARKADAFLRDVLPFFRTAKYISRAELALEFQAQKRPGRRAGHSDYLAQQIAAGGHHK